RRGVRSVLLLLGLLLYRLRNPDRPAERSVPCLDRAGAGQRVGGDVRAAVGGGTGPDGSPETAAGRHSMVGLGGAVRDGAEGRAAEALVRLVRRVAGAGRPCRHGNRKLPLPCPALYG